MASGYAVIKARLAQVKGRVRARLLSPRTEQAYAGCILRHIRYHGTRHPDELGEAELVAYLTHLAAEPTRLPAVLSRHEVRAVAGALHGTMQLIALWLSGPGLRLLACLTLRVKDLDYERSEIRMREAGVARTG